MGRGRLVGLVALALALALPSGASALDRFVDDTGVDAADCTSAAAPCRTIDYAAGQAFDGDTIRIEPGVYTERVQTDRVLTFIGSGAGSLDGTAAATLVRPPLNDGFGYPAFELPRGGTLRALRAEGGEPDSTSQSIGDPGGQGVDFDSAFSGPASLRLENVVAVGGDGGPSTQTQGPAAEAIKILSGPGPVSVSIIDSEFAGGNGVIGSAFTIRGDAATGDLHSSRVVNATLGGLHVGSDAELTVTEVDVAAEEEAAILYDGRLTIRRSRLHSEAYRSLIVSGSSEESPEAELIDSLVTSVGFPAATVDVDEEAAGSLRALGSTLITTGGDEGAVVANREEYGGPASVGLRNSIVRHLAPAGSAVDLLAFKGGSVEAAFSSFSSVEAKEGATITPPGSAGNITGPPGFIDEANGIYILSNASPLIDRGDPGVVAAGQLDLLGAPRSLDGNRDCVAAPDIGAFEVTGQGIACPADPVPTVSGFGMTNRVFAPTRRAGGSRADASAKRAKRGTRFIYTLSEPAKVTITIERRSRGRKARRAGRIRCVKPRRGRTKPRCVRFVRVGALTAQEASGRQSTAFDGRLRGRALRPGRYRATIVAADAAGQRSQPRSVGFRVVRG